MNHETLREQVIDLALGALPPAVARQVEAHVASCAPCAAELASLRGTRAALAGLPPLPAPTRGEVVLLAAARQAAEASTTRRRFALPRWFWGATLGAASAAVAVLLTVQLAGTPPPSRFDEGREALLGGAPPPVRAGEPQESAKTAAPAPVLEARRAAPAVHTESNADHAREMPADAPSRDAVRSLSQAPAGRAMAMRVEAQPSLVASAAPTEVAERSIPTEDRGTEQGLKGTPLASVEPAPKREEAAALAPAAPPVPAARPPGRAKAAPASASGRVAADGNGSANGPARRAPAPAARTEVREDPDCPGERTRTLVRDADGRLVGRERSGTRDGGPWRAIEHFGAEGRLVDARVWLRGSVIVLDRDTLDQVGFERFQELGLAPDTVTAEGESPACR
jgi:hypothetical protein